jgi:hypothetical protein
MIVIAKWTIVLFGVFFIGTGFLMLFSPEKARYILKKAGSTNFINYAEITIRLIPAVAMVYYSEFSKYPTAFKIFGCFMIATSVILYFVPRRLHHDFSLKCAEFLKPQYFQLVSPFSFLIGIALLYSVF